MNLEVLAPATAAALGMLTLIHPCPLSTNIAAVLMLYGWQREAKQKLLIAAAFMFGEVTTFVVLAIVIANGLLYLPAVAAFLQVYIRQLLGPVLVLAGMMIAGILLPGQRRFNLTNRFRASLSRHAGSGTPGAAVSGAIRHSDLFGALFFGMLIALSFCPLSAAIFFGILIPMSISEQGVVIYPLFFGLGAVLPLILVAALADRSTILFARSFLVNVELEKVLRTTSGILMIAMGIYLSFCYIFKLV